MQATIPTSSPRASKWEWAQAALLAANLAWTTLCRGGVRAETVVVTALLTGALIVVHVAGRVFGSWVGPDLRAGRERPNVATGRPEVGPDLSSLRSPLHPAGWWLLPFLAYALSNVIWITPVPWLGWLDWLGWAQMIAVFWVVVNGLRSRGPRRAVFFTLVLLAIGGVGLACYQRFVDPEWIVFGATPRGVLAGRASGSFGIPNSFAGFLLLLLPAVGALAFRRTATATERVWWGWVAVVLSFGLVLTISRGAWLALVIALTVWPLIAVRGAWSRRIRFAAMALSLAVVVGAVIYWKSPKVRSRFTQLVQESGEITRLVMWRGAWQLFRDEPLFGTGAGSYNVAFERHRPAGFCDEPLWAHNEYLNTLSDYGAVGWLLFFGPALGIVVRCGLGTRDDRPRRRDWLDSATVVSGLAAGWLAFALQMGLDFHLKIPALALASATIAGLAVSRAWPPREDAASVAVDGAAGRRVSVAVVAIGVAGALVWFVPRLRAEALRQESRRVLNQLGAGAPDPAAYAEKLPPVRAALARATELDRANGQAWADRSQAAALWAWVQPEQIAALGHEAESHAERALAVTETVSEFWIRRGVARDMQGRWEAAGTDFAKAVAVAPTEAFGWYYYADHLSRRKTGRHAAEAALAFCLRLDPGNPGGLALRQRLAIDSTAR